MYGEIMTTPNNNPVGKRRETQKAETKALILDSARLLFETNGFEKTTIRAVAIHARIGLGTVYKHFDNKICLLAAALYDDLKQLTHDAVGTIPANGTIKEQFIHMAGFKYRYYASRPKLSREYLKHIVFVEGQWARRIEQFDNAYLKRVATLINAAQQRGEISMERDSSLMSLSFMADYFFVLTDMFLRKKITDPDQMLSRLSDLIDQVIRSGH